MAVTIAPPSPASGTASTAFRFNVTSTHGEPFTLSASRVVLTGDGATGCAVSVNGSGSTSAEVTVTSCVGHGALAMRIAECSAPTRPGCATAGDSTAALVNNPAADVPVAMATQPYTGAAGQPMTYELYFPTNWQSLSNLPLYIHVHGGGWTGGDAASDTSAVLAIAKRGFIVANLNYTLAPPYAPGSVAPTPYTAGPNDIQAFVNFATQPAVLASIHADPTRVSVGGSSAGAHLAMQQATRPDNSFGFFCLAEASGPTNLLSAAAQAPLPVTGQIIQGVFGASPPQAASPALNTATLRASRVLIMHAVNDNLVPVGQAYEFAANLAANRPSVEVTRSYWPDVNPTPTVPNHAYGPGAEAAFAAWLDSRCKPTPNPLAPSCSVSFSALTGTTNTDFTASWSSSGTACTFDSDGVPKGSVQCTGTTSSKLTAGSHTLVLHTSGPGGSTSCFSQTVTVTQAPPPPTCTVTLSPLSGNTNTDFTATWSSVGGVSCTFERDGVPQPGVIPCSGTTSSKLTAGSHSFVVHATDATGLSTGSCTSQAAVVTQAPPVPTCTVTLSPAAGTTDTDFSATWSSVGGATCSWMKDGVAQPGTIPCAGTASSKFAAGSHSVVVFPTDATGQSTGACASNAVSVTQGCTLTLSPASGTVDTDFTATWSSLSGVFCTWEKDGVFQGAIPCAGASSSKLSVGSHVLVVRPTDALGTPLGACTSQTVTVN